MEMAIAQVPDALITENAGGERKIVIRSVMGAVRRWRRDRRSSTFCFMGHEQERTFPRRTPNIHRKNNLSPGVELFQELVHW
jgi:hypothetical protein